MDDYNLSTVQLCGHTWTERRFLNERELAEPRRQSGVGPEISELTMACIREAKG
jgi:hypothetical protein